MSISTSFNDVYQLFQEKSLSVARDEAFMKELLEYSKRLSDLSKNEKKHPNLYTDPRYSVSNYLLIVEDDINAYSIPILLVRSIESERGRIEENIGDFYNLYFQLKENTEGVKKSINQTIYSYKAKDVYITLIELLFSTLFVYSVESLKDLNEREIMKFWVDVFKEIPKEVSSPGYFLYLESLGEVIQDFSKDSSIPVSWTMNLHMYH